MYDIVMKKHTKIYKYGLCLWLSIIGSMLTPSESFTAQEHYTLEAIDTFGYITLSNQDRVGLANVITAKVMGLDAKYTDYLKTLFNAELRGKLVTLVELDGSVSHRRMVYPVLEDGQLLQEYLIQRGAVLFFKNNDVYSDEENLRIEGLINKEHSARIDKIGIWKSPKLRIMSAVKLAEGPYNHTGHFHLIQGSIVDIAERRNASYFNTGEDWLTDTTFFISKSNRKIFGNKYGKMMNLEDHNVLIRGWVEKYNGPLVKITDPFHILDMGAN